MAAVFLPTAPTPMAASDRLRFSAHYARIMCRSSSATTATRDASGTPALTASMIIEERSDLNMTRLLTLQFPDQLCGRQLGFWLGCTVIWRDGTVYRPTRRTVPIDDFGRNSRAPVPRFSLIDDNKIIGYVGHGLGPRACCSAMSTLVRSPARRRSALVWCGRGNVACA
jgi:hypothetical protein